MNIKKFGAGLSLSSLLGHITLTSLAALAVNTTFIGDAHAAWFDGDWPYRIGVTVHANKVDSTLTNFPVFVDMSDLPSDFWSNVQNEGEIRVTSSDETTQLAREIKDFSDGGSSGSGHMYFNADSVSSSSDTTFYIYYGNSAGTPDPAAIAETSAWNSNYKAVWHMDEAAESIVDSTSSDIDEADPTQSSSGTSVSGQIGNAIDLNGSSNTIIFETNVTANLRPTGAITVEAWVDYDSLANNDMIIQHGDSTNRGWAIWNYNNALRFQIGDGTGDYWTNLAYADSNLSTGQWYHIAGTFDGSTGKLYVNGSEVDSYSKSTSISYTSVNSQVTIGRRPGGDPNWTDGTIDEVRVSDTGRSAAWVSSTYQNLSNPYDSETPANGFYEFETQEAADQTAPTVSTYSPADDATGVSTTANLVLTFDENVNAQSGASNDIVIKTTVGDTTFETIDAEDAKVTGDGTTTITINPAGTFAEQTEYYVQIGADAFDDDSGNSYAGISNTTTWTFTTADETNPTVSTLNPADNATGVSETANLVLTFAENVTAQSGANNDIVIKLKSGDSTVETIDAEDAAVTVDGATVTINPSVTLSEEIEYYVQIGADAFDDAAGNSYAGISDTTSWTFTIAPGPIGLGPSGSQVFTTINAATVDTGNPSTKTGSLIKQLVLDLPLKSRYYNTNTNRVDDRTPQNLHGTATGPTVRTSSAVFDGTNDYVSIPASAKDYFEDGTFTASLWFNADGITDGKRIFSVDYLANGNHSFYIMVDSNNLSVNVKDGSTLSTITYGISTGAWYHVAVTSSAGGNVTLYVNGESQGTATARTFSDSNNEVHIGRSSTNYASDKYFDGIICNVKVHDRALVAGEVDLLYDKGK